MPPATAQRAGGAGDAGPAARLMLGPSPRAAERRRLGSHRQARAPMANAAARARGRGAVGRGRVENQS
jgi:hypothetical protein